MSATGTVVYVKSIYSTITGYSHALTIFILGHLIGYQVVWAQMPDELYPDQSGIGNQTGRLLNDQTRTQSSAQVTKKARREIDGRVSVRSYVSGDTGKIVERPLIQMSFMETDFHGRSLTSSGLGLDLDATFILDVHQLNERRFGETERFDQVRQLYVTQPIGALTVHLGRRLLSYSGNAWVDGLEAKYRLSEELSIGGYGGLSPDRFDRSLTLDYQAAGIYLDLQKSVVDISLAYNTLFFQGELDRHFIYQRTHYSLTKGLFLSNYLILDLIDSPDITTLLSTIDWTPTSPLNIALTFSRYSLEQYRNQAIYRNIIEPNQALILGNEVIDLVYNRLRFSTSLRFRQIYYHYQMIELKTRAQDGNNAFLYTVGLRNEDVLGSGTELDLRGQFMQNFRSDSLILSVTARKDFSRYLSVDARVTSFKGRTLDQNIDRLRVFDEAQNIYLVGATIMSRALQGHIFMLSYDGVYETELQDLKSDEALFIHTGMFKYTYLF